MVRNFLLIFFLSLSCLFTGLAQTPEVLFENSNDSISNNDLLTIRLELQINKLKEQTNDSTYMPSKLYYKEDLHWDSLPIQIRTRGAFRLKHCVFPPVKLKFDKEDIDQTIFSGNKKLKLVVPCLNEATKNDYVVKEYMAYKLLEPITPYHLKTRLVNMEWARKSGNKKKGFKLKAILLEDIKHLAKRFDGNEYEKTIHPMRIDTLNAIRNAFFQYMIGNNDYSVVHGHNHKTIYVDKKFLIIPYDFDLSGLVNAEYGKTSNEQDLGSIANESIARVYRDYPRDRSLLDSVRQEFLLKKKAIIQNMKNTEKYFENEDDYVDSELYVMKFFKILQDDKKFEKHFIKWADNN